MSDWVICSDFDGTICIPDSSDYLFSRFAPEEWRELDEAIWAGQLTEREGYQRQIALLRATWPEARTALREGVKIREGFREFVQWTRAHGIPFVIISSGMRPLIDELLEHAGVRDVMIESHGARINGNRWELQFHPGARLAEHCSHCKCAHLEAFRQAGKRVIYIGDGFTDVCPARHADMLFATHKLAEVCAKNGRPFHFFSTFFDIERTLDAFFHTTTQESPL